MTEMKRGLIITRATTADDTAAIRALFQEYAAWLRIDLNYQGFAEELATLPGSYATPRGCLLLATMDGQPAGCVALRPINETTCEMKRLYVKENFHGHGLGRALAGRVIAEARTAGYASMVLDTLPHMTGAIRLYESLGFTRRAAYYDTPLAETVFFELRLAKANLDAVVIRELLPDDSVKAITELLHVAYAPLAAMGFKYLATHQDEATTRRRLQSGISIVAELEGVIVGTVTLRAPKAESRCAWYLQPGVWSFGQFAVRPDLARSGLGTRLMRVIEQRALQQGATELALDTAEGATHLIRWYERLGFRFIQHVSWDETNYRSVVMSKRLNAPCRLTQ